MAQMTHPPTVREPDEGESVSLVGDVYRFLATGDETDGRYAMLEAIVPPGGGPPPHIHSREEESFYVLEGEITFQDVERFLLPAVDVGRRSAAGRHDGFKHGVPPVRFVTRCHKAVDIADDGNCLAYARLTNRWWMCHLGHVLL